MERELREAVRAEEQQDRSLFIIRAHHLVKIREFIESGKSVTNFDQCLSWIIPNGKWYLNDVLGSTQEQADKFRRYEKEFYEEFLQLPPDYPVKIVDGQKDKICHGCAIGDHCSKRPMFSWSGSGDEISIRVFIKAAKKLNLQDDVTVVDEIATYSNVKPRKVKSILTTAGTVKKVVLSKSGSSLFSLSVS